MAVDERVSRAPVRADDVLRALRTTPVPREHIASLVTERLHEERATAAALLNAEVSLRFGGGAEGLAGRALRDLRLDPLPGLSAARTSWLITVALAVDLRGAWCVDPEPALATMLRAEPDAFDRVATEGARRLADSPTLRSAAVAQHRALLGCAPPLHDAAHSLLDHPISLSDRMRGMVGVGPDLSAGIWSRPLAAVLLGRLLTAHTPD